MNITDSIEDLVESLSLMLPGGRIDTPAAARIEADHAVAHYRRGAWADEDDAQLQAVAGFLVANLISIRAAPAMSAVRAIADTALRAAIAQLQGATSGAEEDRGRDAAVRLTIDIIRKLLGEPMCFPAEQAATLAVRRIKEAATRRRA